MRKAWPSSFNKNTTQCRACITTIDWEETILENRLFPVTWHYNWAKSILFTCTESWYRGLEWTAHSGVTVRQILNQQILDWDWLLMRKGHVNKQVSETNEWPAKCLSSKHASNSRGLRVFPLNCAWRSGRKEKSAKYLLDYLRLRAVSLFC